MVSSARNVTSVTSRASKTLTSLSFDGGNAYLKWSVGGQARIEPAWGVKIPGWQAVPKDALTTTHENERWVFGGLAQDLGGAPLFELGKKQMTPILLKALIESTGHVAVDHLKLLVPDVRDEAWTEVVQAVQETAPVTRVSLINEGEPPYRWAVQNGLLSWPQAQNGVIDIGGGELSLVMITRYGVINWALSAKLPGTGYLASKIAEKLSIRCVYTPKSGEILRAIEDQSFTYKDDGKDIDFRDVYLNCRDAWIEVVRQQLKTRWASQGTKIGQIIAVGGGVHMLAPLFEANAKRREQGQPDLYLFPSDPRLDNCPQMINAYAMDVCCEA